MGDTDRGFNLVHVLSPLAPRAEGVHFQIRGVDLHLDLLHLRENRHRCGGGMDASLRLGRRHALNPVHPAFELHCPIDIVSHKEE